MDQPIGLIPMVCINCSTPIPAEPNEVAWVCQNCGQGMSLDESKGLEALHVYFSAMIPPNAVGKPYWVAEGTVKLQRATYGGSSVQNEAQQFWSQPHTFFIPAYQAALDALLAQASHYLENPPTLKPGPPSRFEPVVRQLDDIQSAVEFIVVAVEAGRKDKLKQIQFDVTLSQAVLWILPI